MKKQYVRWDEVHMMSEMPPETPEEVKDSMEYTLFALWLTLKYMKYYGIHMTSAEKETRRNESIRDCTEHLKIIMDLIYEKQILKVPRTLFEVEISMMLRRFLDEETFEYCDYFIDEIPKELLNKTFRDVWA